MTGDKDADARRPSISVVIPTMNRAEVLLDTLRDIRGQEFPDFELVVVDQSDTPNEAARALLADFGKPAHYHYVTHFRSLPEARNFGWQTAKGDIIVYIDDDIQCGPGFLREHAEAYSSSDVAMVAGGITEAKGDRTFKAPTGSFNRWTATPVANFHLDQPGFCTHAKGCNFSIRRSVLRQVGGFDENLATGAALYEELELALRLYASGYRCWFAPTAHLTHLAVPMGGCRVGPDVERYMFGMGHNRAILIHRHLAPWHRLTASLRMLVYGLSYSRANRSLRPLRAAIRGMRAGRQAAGSIRPGTEISL